MTERRPLVLVSGETRELPTGDTLPGEVSQVDLTHTSGAVALDLSAGDQFTFDADAYTPTNPITYVAGRAERISSNGPLSLPAGLQEGDIVILTGVRNGNYCGLIGTQGWTVLEDGLIASSDYCHFSYKVMGSTPDTSVDVYGDPDAVYSVVAFRGVDSTTPIDATHGYVEYTSDSTPAPPSVTTVTSNAMILTSIATRNLYLAQPTTTIPSGYTHASDAYTSVNSSGVNNAYKILTTAGSESPGDWSGTTNAYTRSGLLTLPLRPQSASGEKDYTITLSNIPTKGFSRIVVNKDHVDQTFTWVGIDQWTGGVEPTLAVGVNIIDLTFDGTNTTATLIGSENTFVINGAITETVYTITGTTPTIDPANGTIQKWTMTGNSTPSFDFKEGQRIKVYLDDGAGYTLSDTNIDVWDTGGETAPTLLTTGFNIFEVTKLNGDIRWEPKKVGT